MSISIYEASVPVFAQMLGAMDTILERLSRHCAEKKLAPEIFLGARLSPSMYPFVRQVQVLSDWAQNCCAWLAGAQPLPFANEEASIADLRARLAQTIHFIQSLDQAAINDGETRDIVWRGGSATRRMIGRDFLLHQALPQFFFHQTAAYAILRHNGVDLAKRDYMGAPPRLTQA